MNSYAVIILAALLLHYCIELLAEWLNLQALRPELPEELAGLFDGEGYRQSQAYTRAKTQLGLVTRTFDLALLLLVWFGGGFNRLDVLVRGWGWGPIATGLLYLGLLLLAKSLLSLPFSIYATFVVEARFGFNRTSPRTFVLDLLKGTALAAVLGGPLLALVLALFEGGGPDAWLFCWLGVSAFTLALQFVAPTWILPLFNTFTPLAEGELRQRIMDYAQAVDFALDNVFVIDGSRRSSKSNAFFTGFGKHKRIALFDTLIAQLSISELVAVLAHEIGHYRHKHLLQGTAIAIAHTGAMLYLFSLALTREGLFAAFGMEHPSVYAGLLFFGLLLTPLELALSLWLNRRSRRHEFEADRFAAQTTRNPEALAAALQKLSAQNLANLTPHPLTVALHYSHPPLLARIRALRG